MPDNEDDDIDLPPSFGQLAPGDRPFVFGALVPGQDPRSIVAAVFHRPFNVDVTIKGEEITPDMVKRKRSGIGERVEIDLEGAAGVAVVNRVTPEQLLAVVAAIIATSKDAATACLRIRAEVSAWKFQAADGTIA